MDIVVFESKSGFLVVQTFSAFPRGQPSVSKRDPVRFGAADCSAARARSSPRLCAVKAACCWASLSRFKSFIASRLCAFWRCFFVSGCDCDATVDVAAVPPSDEAAVLLGPANEGRQFEFGQTSETS